MPIYRFETTALGRTTASEEELERIELASPRAIEIAHAAIEAGGDHAGTNIRVYDEAGYLIASVDFPDPHEEGPLLGLDEDEPGGDEPGVIRSG